MRNTVFSWHFWVCLTQLLLVSINTHLTSGICLEDERSLLLQLKRNLNYNISESTKLTTWNQTLDCCQWNGVQCDSSSGHVVGLDLSGESITSSSDNLSSLFSLQLLQNLNLANNCFQNTGFPSGFGKLADLRYLNLSNAGFGGQIPMEISQLIKLVILDLSNQPLLGTQLKLENPSLGMLIRNLVNLRGLNLSGVNISASGSEWCKALSSSVPKLQSLSLSSCNLYGGIDASLSKLQSLSEIGLGQNNLAASVPDFMANFTNLTSLKLSSCHLQGSFPQKLFKVSTLRSLDLSFNELLQGTLPAFPLNSSLQTLILSYTNFSGRLPKLIGNLKQLQRIELQNCSFSDSIPSSVTELNRLVYVDFSNNKFSGGIPSFSSAVNLTYLCLANNELSGTLSSTHWDNHNLSKLVNLDLSSNSLSGSIPMPLFTLPSLQILKLGQNIFSGQLEELTTTSLILNTLDLSSNRLGGLVPKSLLGLKGLKVLNLSSNNFSGSLDLNEILQLKNLSSLELSFNNLSVSADETSSNRSSFPQLSTLRLASCNLHILPDFLRNQSKLQVLDLSVNKIHGAIPHWIWEVGNRSLGYLNLSCNSFKSLEQPSPETPLLLKTFDISSNQIQGKVPTLPFSTAIYLDYSKNKFTSISPDIGKNLLFTVYLSLSRNAIMQVIPMTLCNASKLKVLDLSSNHFYGIIPDCIINKISTLGVLNLWGNRLIGQIGDKFPGGCQLNTINFGYNTLSGQVPKSLVNCQQLEVLDFGKNQLYDTFPCWLRNLSDFRVLVLRDNKFYGSLTCSSTNKGWPKLQILDIASNDFDGELTPQCFTNMTALMTREDNPQMALTQLQYPVLKLDNIYYHNMVVVTIKGAEVELQRILTVFTSIDCSKNRFRGNIPDDIGNLKNLIVLNLSYNGFSGSIPSSIGNLSMLESLDLSHNNLSGSIPTSFVSLYFLGFLNLSFNKLVGRIPIGNQLQTFGASSYTGNMKLCGSPLPECSNSTTSTAKEKSSSQEKIFEGRYDWQYIFIGSGIGTGAALVIAPLIFSKKGRKWFDKRTDKLVSAIFSVCGIDYKTLDEEIPQLQVEIGHQLFDITNFHEDMTEEGDYGRFCVFCTKLDIERKRVIHNPRCTCHSLPSIWSSFSLSLSK